LAREVSRKREELVCSMERCEGNMETPAKKGGRDGGGEGRGERRKDVVRQVGKAPRLRSPDAE